MGQPLSMDLRVRVVDAISGEMSRRAAEARCHKPTISYDGRRSGGERLASCLRLFLLRVRRD